MNIGFSNSTADLDHDNRPELSSPRRSLTRCAERLRHKCTEILEAVGLRLPASKGGQSGSVCRAEPNLFGEGIVDPAHLDVRRADGVTTIVLRGVLSPAACDRLAETVQRTIDQKGNRIVLDLTGIEFIDLAGVRVLLLAHLRASDEFTELLLLPALPAVQSVIDAIHGPFADING